MTKKNGTTKESRVKTLDNISKARLARGKQLETLSQIAPVVKVRNIEAAKSVEVLEFCRDFLTDGGRWDELRRKLGLGPAHLDKRWRVIRELIPEMMMPTTEEDALRRHGALQLMIMSELDALVKQIDHGYSEADEKVAHNYLKLKMEALKMKLEESSKEFDKFMDVKKLKSAEKKTQGVSIIVQNNYHIARPGENKLKDVGSE